jgi:hypothetical protein
VISINKIIRDLVLVWQYITINLADGEGEAKDSSIYFALVQ